MTGKGKAQNWIREHCDGNEYSTKQIAAVTGASPAVVRGAMQELHNYGQVFFRKSGSGKNTRYQFWRDGGGDGPSSMKELLLI